MITHDEDARAKNVAPKLEHATLTYGQDPDSNAPTGTILNRLAVQVTDAGGGPYLVLATERWALDPEDVDAFAALLRRALGMVEPEPSDED